MGVVCGTCGKEHDTIFEDVETDQGIDCASTVDDEFVIGHYGSALIDCEIWKWAVGKPIHVKGDIICDECIKPLIESRALVYYKDYMNSDWPEL